MMKRKMATIIGLLAGAALASSNAWAANSSGDEAKGRWTRAESPHFTVYGDVTPTQLKDYVVKLERYDGLLRFLHGMPLDGDAVRKLPIYLVISKTGFETVIPGLGDGVGGFYVPSPNDVFAVALRERQSDHVIQHEYVHHFMLRYFPYGYPAWLTEGYAEYFGSAVIDDNKIQVGRNAMRGGDLRNGPWVSMEKVLSKRPFELTGGSEPPMFYAQAWLLTHYFMSDPARYQQLQAYMKAVGGGADPIKAMTEVTGMSPGKLQIELRGYMMGALKFTDYTVSNLPTPEIKLSPMPAAADDLLLVSQGLRRAGLFGQDEEIDEDAPGATAKRIAEYKEDLKAWGQGLLTQARRGAERYPDAPLARLTLARAELTYGDREAGLKLADAYAAAYPDDPEGFELAGLGRMAIGDRDPARREALYKEAGLKMGQAFKLDPDRFQTLYGYALSRKLDPKYPSDNVLNVLDKAHELAPQVPDITLTEAQALIARGQNADAIALLKPVANSPHGGKTAKQAKALLQKIGGEAPASDTTP
jgi:tetratricopeptide (TPR) repeat protein